MSLTAAQKRVLTRLLAGEILQWGMQDNAPKWMAVTESGRKRKIGYLKFKTINALTEGGYVEFPPDERGFGFTRFGQLTTKGLKEVDLEYERRMTAIETEFEQELGMACERDGSDR